MKTVFEHIEQVKEKPYHVRKRIAFAAATGGTALVALVWIIGALQTGAFAIEAGPFSENAGGSPAAAAGGNGGAENLAGVAAAFSGESAPAHIEIIDASSSTPERKRPEQTIIPF